MRYHSRPFFAAIALFCLILSPSNFGIAGQNQRKSETPEAPPAGNLEIYWVDVEGGAATLIITPARESILVDAGWPGFEGRDPTRIQAAMAKAGVTEIDHLVVTHYHKDHYGGVPELAARVKINHFYDHGPQAALSSPTEDPKFAEYYGAYSNAAKGKRTTLKPGDQIMLKRAPGTPPLTLLCLASNKTTLKKMRKIAKVNQVCKGAKVKPADTTDNARSLVLWMRFGAFDFLDPGDVTWNVEGNLVCPRSPFGAIDLYQVSHHGLNTSNNPVILQTINPTVSIMNNGARKAGSPETIQALRELPSLQAMYQMHLNLMTKPEQNAPVDFVANLTDESPVGEASARSVGR